MIYTCRANAFVMIPEVALEDSRLTRNDICVLAALYKFAKKDVKKKTAIVEHVAFKTLAAESKMSANSKATFYESVNRLKKHGYIVERIYMKKDGEYDNTTYILKDARSVSHLTPVKEGTMVYSRICNKLANEGLVNGNKEAKEFVEKTKIIVYDMVNGDGERIKSCAVKGFKDDKFIDMDKGVGLTLDGKDFTLSEFDKWGIVEMPVEKADKDETPIETPQEDNPVQPVEEKTPVMQEPQEDIKQEDTKIEEKPQEDNVEDKAKVIEITTKRKSRFKVRNFRSQYVITKDGRKYYSFPYKSSERTYKLDVFNPSDEFYGRIETLAECIAAFISTNGDVEKVAAVLKGRSYECTSLQAALYQMGYDNSAIPKTFNEYSKRKLVD